MFCLAFPMCGGDPFRSVLRMCSAFRALDIAKKTYVLEYGLKKRSGTGLRLRFEVCRELPPVQYVASFLEPGQQDCSSDADGELET